MPVPSRAWDSDEVLAYKHGLDRGGRSRTWDEVAAIYGVSRSYIAKIARGWAERLPPPQRYDPRDLIPELAEVLAEEDIDRFHAEHRCLCGCGQNTLRETDRAVLVPRGSYRMFRTGHHNRMRPLWERIRIAQGHPPTPKKPRGRLSARTMQAAWNTPAATTVPLAFIGDLVDEWLRKDGRTVTQIIERTGLPPTFIAQVQAGALNRAPAQEVSRLLAGIGEPMRPEVAMAFVAWAEANRLVAQ